MMIPQNANLNFAYFLLPLPYQHCYAPFSTHLSPTDNKLHAAIETPVKLEEDDSKRSTFVEALPSLPPPAESQRESARSNPTSNHSACGKKEFKKDRRCPAHTCRRKYSSRIALRAHIRKEHPGWY
jgi:hypothetical protein